MTSSPHRQARFISLRVKLLVGFTLLFTVVFVAVSLWFYTFATTTAQRRIEEDLLSTLQAAVENVDGDRLIALYQEAQPREDGFTDDPRYWQDLEWLDVVHHVEPRAWPYTYVAGPREGEVIFLTDLFALYDPESAVKFGESCYNDPGCGDLSVNLQALNGEVVLEKEIYTDKWGSWLSAYAPVKNSAGEIVAGLGIDFEADYVNQVQQAVSKTVTLVSIVAYLILFLMVYLASITFTRPIISLTRAAERIGEGDYDQDLTQIARGNLPDEIDILVQVFQGMIGKVYQREQTLRRQVEELQIVVDRSKRDRQVSEIVSSDFFQDLQQKAIEMRARSRGSHERGSGPSTKTTT